MVRQPEGTVSFLFSDIEGSTRLLAELGRERYAQALERHRVLLRESFDRRGGYEVDCEGDSFIVAFQSAAEAVAAASEAQRALRGGPIRVRMGLHTGEPLLAPPKYVGLDVHKAARIMAAGHGGQVLLSQTTRDLAEVEARDLGEHRLKDLLQPQRLFQLLIEGLPDAFPALKTLENRPTNLPMQPNPLIGRGRELKQITALLRGERLRLLTLTGPGGTGKTRLALQVAAELLDDFRSGVFFVSLAPIRDSKLVVPTIAYTLGLREVPGEDLLETLIGYLEEKQMLLILDNFEQVIDVAASLSKLLAKVPQISLLVTSRERLRLSAEQTFAVPPLELPDPDRADADELIRSEAVALFVARAQALKPEFALSEQNAHPVAQICVRLDGLPLAIELAAARIAILTPEAMLTRLDRRLALLTAGARDAHERQQTLRATIEWSDELLSEEERQLFARLAVFTGGCTLEAAEEIACAEIGRLQSLVEKNLVRTSDGRYWMLETIREYAEERLERSGEAEEIRGRRDNHFLALAELAGSELHTARQAYWLPRLDAEEVNLGTVLASALEARRPDIVCRLAISLWRYWESRERITQARRLIEPALVAESGVARPLRAQALFAAARMALRQGAHEAAQSWFAEGKDLSCKEGDDRGTAMCLAGLGYVASKEGHEERAEKLCRQSLTLARACGDTLVISDSLNNLGCALWDRDREAARAAFEESLALRKEIGDLEGVTASLGNLGGIALEEGDLESVAVLIQQSQQLAEERGDLWAIAGNLLQFAALSFLSGRLSESLVQARRAIEICEGAGYRERRAHALRLAASCLAAEGRDEDAARLHGAADALGYRVVTLYHPLMDESLERTRERLGEDEWDAARKEGERLRTRDAIELLAAAPTRA